MNLHIQEHEFDDKLQKTNNTNLEFVVDFVNLIMANFEQ